MHLPGERMHTTTVLRRASTALAALLLVAPAARAGAQMNAGLSIAAGATLPTGALGDVAKTGYHVTVGAELRNPISPLGFRLEGMFNEMDFDQVSNVKARVIGGIANVVYTRSPAEGPYLIGGLGIYRTSATSDGRTIAFTESTNLGLNGGIGVRFALTGFSTFAEVRYHYITGGDVDGRGGKASFAPFTFGVTF
jgi:hypothetical protein